jgi:hypothetical protein
MQFDFIAMQRMYLSLARQDAAPLAEALTSRPAVSRHSQWATFVRNHDELTLDKLSEDEREEVFAAFGPDEDMQVYGRGLRRRLPPMLGGDPRRVRMVYSLLFSLPGTPVLFYGEEIGMGENLDVPGRMAVRTPMQWSAAEHGGFSTASADRLPAPVVEGGYAPEFVNVQSQRHDPTRCTRSCGCWSATTAVPGAGVGRRRGARPAARRGARALGDVGRRLPVALHNLSADPVSVPLSLGAVPPGTTVVDLLADGSAEVPEDGEVAWPSTATASGGCAWCAGATAGSPEPLSRTRRAARRREKRAAPLERLARHRCPAVGELLRQCGVLRQALPVEQRLPVAAQAGLGEGGELRRQLLRGGERLTGGDHPVGEPHGERLGGVDRGDR